MNIIIVGCGQVGETLAAELREENNDITVVDLSPDKINSISTRLDVMGIVGNGATHTVQMEAGIEKADLLIAVTNSDELNLLCCMIAKRHSNCQVIARIRSPEYNKDSNYLKNELGLAMVINPEKAAADEIARVLRFPAASQIDSFSSGRVELLKYRLHDDSALIGRSVRSLAAEFKTDVLICTVERDDEAYIVNGDFVFENGDLISIIATPKNAAAFFKQIGYTGKPIKDAIIVGISDMTHYLCRRLEGSGIALKIIDKDMKKCEELSASYEKATVICGDETDQATLIEEGIERAGAFVALTDFDEENIFLSLSAKKFGSEKIIAKIDKPEYDDVIKHLNLDSTIYPKSITADVIARFVRSMKAVGASNVETMYSVIKGEVEATEFKVNEGAPVTDIPLTELGPKLKSGVLVAAILRNNKVIIPHGQDAITAGDSVVIVSKTLGLEDISDILR